MTAGQLSGPSRPFNRPCTFVGRRCGLLLCRSSFKASMAACVGGPASLFEGVVPWGAFAANAVPKCSRGGVDVDHTGCAGDPTAPALQLPAAGSPPLLPPALQAVGAVTMIDWSTCDWGGFTSVLNSLNFWRGW